jgi:hypothetical protein
LSASEYEYLALKAAEIAGTRLWRQFGYISIILTISIALGLYAYVQTEIDNAIEKEVANYLETQGGEQVTRSIRSNVDFVRDLFWSSRSGHFQFR